MTNVTDANNNVITSVDAKSQTTSYTWGYGHQMLTRTSTAGSLTYTRNALGQPTRVINSSPSMSTTYSYDAAHRLKTVTDSRGGKTLSYAYSPGGLLNRMTDSEGHRTYYVYDAANQLKEIHSGTVTTLVYDNNGNLSTKTEGSTTTTYTYDALDRLTQVAKPGTSTQVYAYDHEGKRIAKTVGSTTTNYLYSGPDIMAEYTSWTAASALYVHGPETDQPVMRIAGSTKQYYHEDGLGSLVAFTNASGGTDATQRFDAWGARIAGTGAIPQYGYTGREPDETGLVYYRARYYDPAIGRFTQRDPIGLKGGVNQYTYVGSNPVNLNDPTGLLAESSWTNSYTQTTSYYGSGTTLQSLGLNAGSQSLSTVGGGLWEQTAQGNTYAANNGQSNWATDATGASVQPKSPDCDFPILDPKYLSVFKTMGDNLGGIDPTFIMAVVVQESGWKLPHVYETNSSSNGKPLNNLFGSTYAGGNNIAYPSIQAGATAWEKNWGPYLTDKPKTIDAFTTDLTKDPKHMYNSSPDWPAKVRKVHSSIINRLDRCGIDFP